MFVDSNIEILRYLPVGLVACVESYFRRACADLINFGAPYTENAAKMDQKISIAAALKMGANSVSIGEFVAHSISVNNLTSVGDLMRGLTGQDFISEVKVALALPSHQLPLFPEDPQAKTARVIGGMMKAFELRHIFCHESDPRSSDLHGRSDSTAHVVDLS
jgi:hypothetical protein